MKIALSTRMIVIALGVLLITSGAAVVAAKLTHDSEMRVLQATFDERDNKAIAALQGRLHSYEIILRGASGLINANTGALPTRDQWHEYVRSLQLSDQFPSVQAVSLAQLVPADRKASFDAAVRNEGSAAGAIFPVSDHAEFAPISLVEPQNVDNARALGFDLLSEPTRRDAALMARDSGLPTLTGRVSLLMDPANTHQAANLLILPVYRKGVLLGTSQQRHEAAIGFISCVFRFRDFVADTLGNSLLGIRFELYDRASQQSSNLLFQSGMTADQARHDPLFRMQTPLLVAGRSWLARFSSLPEFEQSVADWSYLVLSGGVTIGVLLALVVLSLGSSERRAIRFAEVTTRALSRSENRHRSILSNTADGIFTTDARGTLLTMNPSAEAMFGYTADEIVGRNLEMLIPHWMQDMPRKSVDRPIRAGIETASPLRGERMGRRSDGENFPIDLAINPMSLDGEQHLVGVVGDISERKRVEGMLAESNAFWKSVLDNSPVSIITFDPSGLLLTMNPAAERMLGYKSEDLIGKVSYLMLHDAIEVRSRMAETSIVADLPEAQRGLAILVEEARNGLVEEHDWTYVRRDGEQIPVRLTISPLNASGPDISGFLAIAYDVTERKRSEEYSRHIAQHDFLTGLPNRLLLHERVNMAIDMARGTQTKVGVLLIDLDHFKRINDSLGHHVGDQLLQQLADRLCKLTGASDTVARMGGDEFVVLKVGLHSSEEVLRLAVTLLRQISEPFALGPHELHVTPSIGLSVFPDDGQDMHVLLKNADAALYDAKENGRNRVQLFTAAMVMAASEKMDLEKALRAALQRQELSVHLQPLMNLATGQVDGAEALIRWNHPQRGWISPASFIPLAEQTGLIVPISDWLLSVACREIVALQKSLNRPLTLAVNFSPKQFRDRGLAQYVEGVLKLCDMQPQHLELEITEGVLMANSDETLDMLRELHQVGVRISIDDFGTGYSSLSYLTRFKIDKLKIDRSFVRDIIVDPADAAVTNAIIAMAHGLGVKVVAEGIETLEQLSYLTRSGCDQGQGFYFSKAVPAKDFHRLVEELESDRYRKVARFVFPGMKES